jgi:hypothetical protein
MFFFENFKMIKSLLFIFEKDLFYNVEKFFLMLEIDKV